MLSKRSINNIISKLESPTKRGPNNCPVYLRLPYLGKVAKFLKNKVKETINSTFGAVNLRISHFTRLNGIFKDVTPDPEKNKVIYRFKCHCESVYIGRTSQTFHLRKDQCITKSLSSWMANGDNKPKKSPSAIEIICYITQSAPNIIITINSLLLPKDVTCIT